MTMVIHHLLRARRCCSDPRAADRLCGGTPKIAWNAAALMIAWRRRPGTATRIDPPQNQKSFRKRSGFLAAKTPKAPGQPMWSTQPA